MSNPYSTVTPERRRRVDRAAKLRESGYLQREIAEMMGLSRGSVADLLGDPENEKKRVRRLTYGGICRRCGETTCGADGSEKAPDICSTCSPLEQHENRHWTPERIIEVFADFHERIGRSPTSADAQVQGGAPSMEKKLSAARLSEITALPSDLVLPRPSVVMREFGSWAAALNAANLPPNSTGGAAHRNRGNGGRKMPRRFVVLSKDGVNWLPRATVDARDTDEAIELVADGEGVYVAVAEANWQERSTVSKTVFGVVDA